MLRNLERTKMIDTSKLLTINPYDEQKFRAADNSWFLPKISKNSTILWRRDGSPVWSCPTPREVMASSLVSAVPFYYLEYLREINPDSIIDIGCGSNIFKSFFKNLIGFDPRHSAADITEYYDTEYETENR